MSEINSANTISNEVIKRVYLVTTTASNSRRLIACKVHHRSLAHEPRPGPCVSTNQYGAHRGPLLDSTTRSRELYSPPFSCRSPVDRQGEAKPYAGDAAHAQQDGTFQSATCCFQVRQTSAV